MAQRGNYLPHFDICPEFKGDLIEDNFRMNIYIYIFIIVSDREQNHLPGALEDAMWITGCQKYLAMSKHWDYLVTGWCISLLEKIQHFGGGGSKGSLLWKVRRTVSMCLNPTQLWNAFVILAKAPSDTVAYSLCICKLLHPDTISHSHQKRITIWRINYFFTPNTHHMKWKRRGRK